MLAGMLNVLSCLVVLPSIGHVVVVAAAVDAKVVAVARARVVVREGGSAWGGLRRGGVCCLVVAVVRSSPLQVAAADVGGDACGSKMAVGRYEMAAWLGSRGMGGKHEFIGISIGVIAETDGGGDNGGCSSIGAEMTNGKGVTKAATVMMVGEAGAVTMVDKVKTVVVTPRAQELEGQRQGGVEAAVDMAEEAGACTDAGMDVTGSDMAAVGKMGSMMAGGMKAKATGGGA
ncbi:hypothetical protein F5148DRAFT_1149420 [Russula earlei]|uniref:Uncharacterized protein n=1 Tax=Russula earlei TaxID=71964 RepID=A0ACC0U894_9AGAM|nr:hypothetical protein F5148DRAFT_1149420 [Russula earlei]